jgi:hypothetical protein
MTDAFVDTPAEPAEDRNQLIAALVLGAAAILTAFAAYNAALLDGEALQGYTQSTRILSDANAFYAQGNQTSAIDQQIFVEYATAQQTGNAELAEYLTTLMRPELVEAVEWWESTEEAVTPFDDDEGNPYTLSDFDEAQALEEEAETQFEEGSSADEKGDKFELATVAFALTLFFGGVATLFRRRTATVGLLGVGLVTLLGGLAVLATAI